MEVRDDIDITDTRNFWSGAVDTLITIRNADKLDEWEQFAEDYFAGTTPTITEINDLLWFESDYVFEALGIKDEGEAEDEAEEGV